MRGVQITKFKTNEGYCLFMALWLDVIILQNEFKFLNQQQQQQQQQQQ